MAKLSTYPNIGRLLTLKGLSMVHGAAFRELGYLRRHVSSFCPWYHRYRCLAPPERKYSVWIGGSILSAVSVFQSMLITKEAYEDVGPSIVHRHL